MKKLRFIPKAVIFDMDGVIVDSMPYHFMAWYEALRPYGVRVSCFDVYAKEGEKWEKTLRDFLVRAGVEPTGELMEKVFRLRKRIFKRQYRRFFFKGADGFIECLKKKGYPLALVTGTNSKELKRILPGRLRKFFDCIVAGDTVKKGKPHPEPYAKAARALGVAPGECVVIENAPFGIESAKKAGMFCIALTTSLPAGYLQKADIVVKELKDIDGIIASCEIKNSSKKNKK